MEVNWVPRQIVSSYLLFLVQFSAWKVTGLGGVYVHKIDQIFHAVTWVSLLLWTELYPHLQHYMWNSKPSIAHWDIGLLGRQLRVMRSYHRGLNLLGLMSLQQKEGIPWLSPTSCAEKRSYEGTGKRCCPQKPALALLLDCSLQNCDTRFLEQNNKQTKTKQKKKKVATSGGSHNHHKVWSPFYFCPWSAERARGSSVFLWDCGRQKPSKFHSRWRSNHLPPRSSGFVPQETSTPFCLPPIAPVTSSGTPLPTPSPATLVSAHSRIHKTCKWDLT